MLHLINFTSINKLILAYLKKLSLKYQRTYWPVALLFLLLSVSSAKTKSLNCGDHTWIFHPQPLLVADHGYSYQVCLKDIVCHTQNQQIELIYATQPVQITDQEVLKQAQQTYQRLPGHQSLQGDIVSEKWLQPLLIHGLNPQIIHWPVRLTWSQDQTLTLSHHFIELKVIDAFLNEESTRVEIKSF